MENQGVIMKLIGKITMAFCVNGRRILACVECAFPYRMSLELRDVKFTLLCCFLGPPLEGSGLVPQLVTLVARRRGGA